MLVWVLVAACWTGLLLLILHDATREDSKGSAVALASRGTMGIVWKALDNIFHWTRSSAETISPVSRKVTAATESTWEEATELKAGSPASPSQNTQPKTIEQQPAATFKTKWWSKDRRASITPAELELAIADAVRRTAPECEDFIGVIVHHRTPKIHLDPNWAVRGVKFGKADRRMVDEALTSIVEQLQREFRLAESQLKH